MEDLEMIYVLLLQMSQTLYWLFGECVINDGKPDLSEYIPIMKKNMELLKPFLVGEDDIH